MKRSLWGLVAATALSLTPPLTAQNVGEEWKQDAGCYVHLNIERKITDEPLKPLPDTYIAIGRADSVTYSLPPHFWQLDATGTVTFTDSLQLLSHHLDTIPYETLEEMSRKQTLPTRSISIFDMPSPTRQSQGYLKFTLHEVPKSFNSYVYARMNGMNLKDRTLVRAALKGDQIKPHQEFHSSLGVTQVGETYAVPCVKTVRLSQQDSTVLDRKYISIYFGNAIEDFTHLLDVN